MKRICFAIAMLGLFALGFTSCSKDVEKCWKVDISMKMESMDMSVTNYIWATENDLEYNIDNLKKEYDMPGIEIKVKKSTTRIKTEEDCFEKNDSMFDY
jgi:hypothetical protein